MLLKRDADRASRYLTSPSGTRMQKKGRNKAWNALLLLPYLAMLWVPFYNAAEPTLWGFPFFYWYQFLWVLICSAVIGVVHAMTKP
jgi:hypothetical protein